MAEERRTIAIDYRVDIDEARKRVKQLPKENQKAYLDVLKNIDRQQKQTQKALEKSAKQSATAAKRIAREFRDAGKSADMAADKLKRVGESSGDIDRGLSGVGLALRGVNPQLAEAADSLADTFAVVESLSVGFGALNPIVLAGAAAIGTLTLGYMSYQAELEKTRDLVLAVRDAQKQLNDESRNQSENIADALNKVEAIQDQYALLTGEITEYEFALRESQRAVGESLQTNIDAQNQIIKQRQKDLELVSKLEKASRTLGVEAVILSDEEKARLQTLQFQNDAIDNRVNLLEKGSKVTGELAKLEDIIENQLAREEVILGGLEEKRAIAADQAKQIAEFEFESAQSTKETSVNIQNTVDSQKEYNRLLQEAIDFGDQQIEAALKLGDLDKDLAIRAAEIRAKISDDSQAELEAETLRMEDRYQKEVENLIHLANISGETAKAKEIADKLTIQRENEYFALVQEHQKKIREQQIETATKIGEAITNSLSSVTGIFEIIAADNKKAQEVIFKASKAAALADIAIKTAQAIAAANLIVIPGLRGAAIASAVATGAAQTATVLSQQPKFHSGGMIGPDEVSITAQRGEAVLDRRTVRNIGGEEGVRQLQNNSNSKPQEIVVRLPYKHHDLFQRDSRKRTARRVGSGKF